MDDRIIKKGKKICQTFSGGIYEEIYLLRKSAWVNSVLADYLMSTVDGEYVRQFNDTDVGIAKSLLATLKAKNDEIDTIENEIQ